MQQLKVQPNDFGSRNNQAFSISRPTGTCKRANGNNPSTRVGATTATKARTASAVLLSVKPKVFVGCWWMVVIFHLLDGGFLVAQSWLYFWLLHDLSTTYFLLGNLKFDMSYDALAVLNWGFVICALLHGVALIHIIVQSLLVQQLTFAPVSSRVVSIQARARAKLKRKHKVLKEIAVFYQSLVLQFFAPFVFIDGEFFDEFFLLQEVVEVASQIYQAYQMSALIASRLTNSVVVGMIFINCMSTPLIHYLVPANNVALRRLLEVTMSAFLNFINSVVIPMVIFWKYIGAYDPSNQFFPDANVFDDLWYAEGLRENQQLFVTSYLDFVSTLWPHCSLFNCLFICRSTLQRDPSGAMRTVTVVPANRDGSAQRSDRVPRTRAPITIQIASLFRFVLKSLLCLSGIVVLGIHVAAQSAPQIEGCTLPATPWFVSGQVSCVVMNINCYRRQIDGQFAEIDAILEQLNDKTMVTLILTHCPKLEMPPSVHKFHKMDGIDIYNSTLQLWSVESAVCQQWLPVLSYVYFIRSNLTSIPEGLLQECFPPNVMEVFFRETNLSSLPDVVSNVWSNMYFSAWEFNRFQEIPPLIYETGIAFAYLAGNPFHVTPQDLFDGEALAVVSISGTALTSLPVDANGSLSALSELYIEHTAVEEVPKYLQQWYHSNIEKGISVVHSLYGSAYCNKSMDDSDAEERLYQEQVCVEDLGTALGWYPMDIMVPQRLP